MSTLQRVFTSKLVQKIINKRKSTQLMGKWADKKLPKYILKPVVKNFIRKNKININDYHFSLNEVSTFNHFFTREFKPGIRVFAEGICSPVEGYCSSMGMIDKNKMYQVKGKEYAMDELLGASVEHPLASYVTIYLSPADYHRIHAPFDMNIKEIKHIPGNLYSVNQKTTQNIDKLYCKNERVILSGTSEYGKFDLVIVGAIMVGRIKISGINQLFSGQLNWNAKKGEELGYFEIGASTIILIIANDTLSKIQKKLNDRVLLGEKLC